MLSLTVPVVPASRPALAAQVAPTTGVDSTERLLRSLRTESSPQARLQAAQALSRLGSDRDLVVPALVQTLMEDPSEAVRAGCAAALGQLGDSAARGALKAARSDTSAQVRANAETALQRLERAGAAAGTGDSAAAAATAADPDHKRITLTLGRMGAKARGLTPDLPRRLREAIVRELRMSPDVQLLEEERQPGRGFSVESSVTEMSRRTTPSGELEVTCEVSMIIGLLPARTMVGMTSGGATIQAPRRLSQRPTKAMAQSLEQDALSHAVRGANQNLLAFLRNQK